MIVPKWQTTLVVSFYLSLVFSPVKDSVISWLLETILFENRSWEYDFENRRLTSIARKTNCSYYILNHSLYMIWLLNKTLKVCVVCTVCEFVSLKRIGFTLKKVTWIEISSGFKEHLQEVCHLYLIIHTKAEAADYWILLETQQIVVCVSIWPVTKVEKLGLLVLYVSFRWVCV